MNRKHSFFRWWYYVGRYGWPKRIYYFHGGLGDQLLCTAVGRELAKRGVEGFWWFTDYAPLFRHCRDLRPLVPRDDGLARRAEKYGVPIVKLFYEEHEGDLVSRPAREHLITELCRMAGIRGEVGLRPYWPDGFTSLSRSSGRPRVAIHSSSLNAKFPMPNKQWPVERWDELVRLLGAEVDFVQLGDVRDPLLPGVEDRRGCSIDEAATTLRGADLFVGMVGFLMHLARSVDCPSVIVYGGREPAAFSGYLCNANIELQPPCSPCWLNERCDYERRCLTGISVEQVVGEVRRMLAADIPRPLQCETVTIA